MRNLLANILIKQVRMLYVEAAYLSLCHSQATSTASALAAQLGQRAAIGGMRPSIRFNMILSAQGQHLFEQAHAESTVHEA
jgi:hypothetical protein